MGEGAEQRVHSFSRIEVGDGENSRRSLFARCRRQRSIPGIEIDQFGHDGDPLAIETVKISDAAGGVRARRDDAIGPANVARFEPRLRREREPLDSALVFRFVGQHALDRGDVRPTSPRRKHSVEIESNDGVGLDRSKRLADSDVEAEAGDVRLTGDDRHLVAERCDRIPKSGDAHPRAASFGDCRRRSGHEDQPRHEVCIAAMAMNDPEEVRRYYEAILPYYDESLADRGDLPFWEAMAAGSKRILELGCGTGRVTEVLVRHANGDGGRSADRDASASPAGARRPRISSPRIFVNSRSRNASI